MGRGSDNQQNRLNNQFGDMQISGGRGNFRGRGSSRGRGGWQNRGSNIRVLCVIIVAKQAILQPSVMLREMIFAVVNCSKETMHRLHDRMKTEKSICLLCSI